MNNTATGKPFTSARDFIAKNVKELWRVYSDVSEINPPELIDMNQFMHPEIKTLGDNICQVIRK